MNIIENNVQCKIDFELLFETEDNLIIFMSIFYHNEYSRHSSCRFFMTIFIVIML